MAFVEFQDVTKYYQMGEQKIAAADGVTFSICLLYTSDAADD